MFKVFNWFFGSFFRTLGRVLVFILLGYILFSFINISDIKLPNLFGVLNVNADTINVSNATNGYVLINNNTFNYQDFYNKSDSDVAVRFGINVPLSYTNLYSYAFIDICSGTDIFTYRSNNLGQACANSCFSNQVMTTKTNYFCRTGEKGEYSGKIFRITVPISKWQQDTADELGTVNDLLSFHTNQESWNPLRVYGVYLTDTSETGQYQVDYSNAINDINSSINGVNGSINEVNSSINGVNDSINNSDISGASDSANNFFNNFSTDTHGLTGIITAPLNAINSLTNKTCNPLVLPLPFVDKDLTLPCMRELYDAHFGSFMTIYDTITLGIVSYWVCVRIFSLVKDFKNPEHDEVEVVDL